MTKDKRKAPRVPIRYSAWIVLGTDQLLCCSLSDISDSGARLEADKAKDVPDFFTLLLADNGAAKRKCRVVWRDGIWMGVTFELRSPLAERLTPPPIAGAEPVSRRKAD